MTSAPSRVVLVEDDAAMQLYVQTALQHLVIDLICCGTVAHAWDVLLEASPPRLLISDLMLGGGESGLALIERVRSGPAGLRGMRVVVTSAAADARGVRERLLSLGVWRVLHKPVALDVIEGCVREALEDVAPLTRLPGATMPAATRATPRHREADVHAAAAVADLFGGDWALYARFRQDCLLRFEADVEQGDAAFERGDSAPVRHLAHNLRSVLRTLGEPAAAVHAERVEAAVLAEQMQTALAAWRDLRAALLRLLAVV